MTACHPPEEEVAIAIAKEQFGLEKALACTDEHFIKSVTTDYYIETFWVCRDGQGEELNVNILIDGNGVREVLRAEAYSELSDDKLIIRGE
ncbi:hypothetical protein GCM10011394_21190 [Luteimonas terricola]|uniref:Uncharacterized protein n=1 Tax=Luteimonas terricola TaxID=645597 RepID=A0ABQ2EGL5_9GAMM|nr:hypothetical protein GCM10011394_21190 [Luteimonas terricola]